MSIVRNVDATLVVGWSHLAIGTVLRWYEVDGRRLVAALQTVLPPIYRAPKTLSSRRQPGPAAGKVVRNWREHGLLPHLEHQPHPHLDVERDVAVEQPVPCAEGDASY